MQSRVDAPGPGRDDRSLRDLFSELSQETSTLVRQEVDLAKTEMSQKASRVGKDAGFLAAGGIIAYAGFLAILAAVIIGLADIGVPWWLSALLVGVIVAIVGGILAQKGWSDLKKADLTPRETMESLQQDKNMVKEQI